MKYLFFLILGQFPLVLFAQDTLYFDRDWNHTTRDKHEFYRLLPMKRTGEIVFIQDFYKNGRMQMQGYALASDEQSYVGDSYWYDEEGIDKDLKQSANNSSVKELAYYHPDGSIWQKIVYNSNGKKEKITVYLKNKVLSTGFISEDNVLSGVFSPNAPQLYYDEINIESEPMIDSSEAVDAESEPMIDTAAVVVDGEEPTIVEAIPVMTSPAKVNYTEILYWLNGQKAREYTYGDYGSLIKSKYYSEKGQLINEFSRDESGTSFTYYQRNGFALAIKTKDVRVQGEDGGRIVTEYNLKGQLTRRSTFQEGELAEVIIFEEGKEKSIQKYKDGEPFDGLFTNERWNKVTTYQLTNGQRVGKEETRNMETGEIFASGTYKDGQPYEGYFYTGNDEYFLLHYKNGNQEGVQQEFVDSESTRLQEEYEMKAGKRDGFRRIYRDGTVEFESEYRNDVPVSGTIVDDGTQAIYENGTIVKKLIFSKYNTDNPSSIENYSNNTMKTIEYFDFTISEHPQESYVGEYKDGKPFDGYFKSDTLIDNIQLVSYYEQGTLKYKYSFELLDQLENYMHYTYDRKSEYNNGKIVNGPDYKLADRNALITSHYESGKVTAFDVNVFAMHYFNRIIFKYSNDKLLISEMTTPLRIVAFAKDNNIVAELWKEDVLIKKSRGITMPEEGTRNSITRFYTDNQQIKKYIMAVDSLDEQIDEEDSNSLVSKLFYQFPVENSADLGKVFKRFYDNFNQEDLNRVFEMSINENFPINETNYLGDLQYDEHAKPVMGLRITQQADKTVVVETIVDGKLKATNKFKSVAALLENDRAELRELEHKMLNEY
ncbi:hypothetical protein [Sphingobacterium spiritivorum]|uniref:hypothetical protein n=1 Tax=Sphingobacterium spiritivorum TaxID=258 RepID=UPI001918FB4F|nr:hypothetical protein [Sphingobacterium spiritivorum]QQT25764.1 hypothetical protein I6J02_18935 [Sphingobacterium spiritivorum]